MIHARQSDYYKAIRQSSAQGASTSFIIFMLEIILEIAKLIGKTDQISDQVARLLAILKETPKTAAELMAELGLSHRPTFRHNYLHPAMDAGAGRHLRCPARPGWSALAVPARPCGLVRPGLVEMTRPQSPRAKNQKYRLSGGVRDCGLYFAICNLYNG